jgi:hypothetical protein
VADMRACIDIGQRSGQIIFWHKDWQFSGA